MNENLDLTKILEGCPVGTKFYHLVYGEVRFCMIDTWDYNYPIQFIGRGRRISVTEDGKTWRGYDGECIVFPSKDQRDWSRFERFWDKQKVEKFDPKTLQPFDKVLIKNGNFWTPNFFGYIAGQWVNCVGTGDVECVPYNEETKHLIGTNDDCPEYYKWWEK